ncbi:hypothetical protein C5E11_16095 [Clavibacter michiganensis]|nr:hypothetical protein C5E11_16095 [Clavibacter michiganensis]
MLWRETDLAARFGDGVGRRRSEHEGIDAQIADIDRALGVRNVALDFIGRGPAGGDESIGVRIGPADPRTEEDALQPRVGIW